MEQKRIKVRLTENSPYSEYGYYEKGDIGYIDGYVNGNAVIILENGKFAKADLRWIEAVNEEYKNVNTGLNEDEDERIRKALKEYFINSFQNNGVAAICGVHIKDILAWLERQCEKGINGNDREIPFSEQILANSAKTCKDAWSEEDERIYNLLYEEYKNLAYYSHSRNQARDIPGEVLGWLKSLKERVQPKQEWSEEDENIRNEVIKYFKSLLECLSTEKRHAENRKWINWLESLRPQNWTKEDKERYISCLQRLSTGNPEQPETINSEWFKEHVYPQPTWKPSDEQMKLLREVQAALLGKDCHNRFVNFMYELKRLKEG